jgi:putative transcriptional regulator
MEYLVMDNGRKILRGLEEAARHARGEAVNVRTRTVFVPNAIDVRAIREKLGLSQEEFALRFGFSLGTVRHWEQGRRYPDGAARVLLTVIDRQPKAVDEALAACC